MNFPPRWVAHLCPVRDQPLEIGDDLGQVNLHGVVGIRSTGSIVVLSHKASHLLVFGVVDLSQ